MESLPRTHELLKPLLQVLKGAGVLTNNEIEERVVEILSIPKEMREVIHAGTRSELNYRLAWARTLAKSEGYVTNSGRSKWRITSEGEHYLTAM